MICKQKLMEFKVVEKSNLGKSKFKFFENENSKISNVSIINFIY